MSMRTSGWRRTICEVLREANDLLQEIEPEKAEAVRVKLREAEGMAKRMSKKLVAYNKGKDPMFWEANPDYEKDLERRLDETYIH